MAFLQRMYVAVCPREDTLTKHNIELETISSGVKFNFRVSRLSDSEHNIADFMERLGLNKQIHAPVILVCHAGQERLARTLLLNDTTFLNRFIDTDVVPSAVNITVITVPIECLILSGNTTFSTGASRFGINIYWSYGPQLNYVYSLAYVATHALPVCLYAQDEEIYSKITEITPFDLVKEVHSSLVETVIPEAVPVTPFAGQGVLSRNRSIPRTAAKLSIKRVFSAYSEDDVKVYKHQKHQEHALTRKQLIVL